jgi:hypothetical protein
MPIIFCAMAQKIIGIHKKSFWRRVSEANNVARVIIMDISTQN